MFLTAEPERSVTSMMVRILNVLEEMKETQRVHGGMLQSLLRKVNEHREQLEMPNDANLPLATAGDFDAFEVKAQDAAFQTAIVCTLCPRKNGPLPLDPCSHLAATRSA